MLTTWRYGEENKQIGAIRPGKRRYLPDVAFASRIISPVKYRPKPLTLNTPSV
jgi:hypothetical protein